MPSIHHKVNSKYIISILTLQLALPILSTDIYLPSLKQMQVYFQVTHHQIQLTLTSYFLLFAVVQLIYGPLSDRLGRKPIFLLSLSIYTVASLLCALAVTIPMLLIGRILQALGAGSAIIIFAMVRDLYEGKQVAKWIAFMSAIVALSPIIAPIFGGYIQNLLSWRYDFWFLFAIGLALLFLYRFLPETNVYQAVKYPVFRKAFRDYQRLVVNPQFMSNAFAASFAFGALFSFISGSPYVLQILMGYSSQSFGLIFALAAIGYVAGALISSQLVIKYGLDLMGHIGIITLMTGSIIMVILCYFFPINATLIIMPQIICEFGISIVVSISIAKALQPIPDYAGAGSGLIGFMRFSAAALSSYLVVLFKGTTSLSLAIIIFLFSMFSLIALITINDDISITDDREITKC